MHSTRSVLPPAADVSFRTSAPRLEPVVELPPPVAQEATLANGLRLVLLERHDVPFVSLRLVVQTSAAGVADAGSVHVGQMAFLFARGGGAADLDRRVADAAADGFGVAEQAFSDRMMWSSHSRASSLDLACELLQRRSFGARLTPIEYGRRTEEWLQARKAGHRPAWAAERYVLFGDQDSYGYAGWAPTPMSLSEAVAVRASLLRPDRATLLVVGDATFDVVHAIAERAFGGVPTVAPAVDALPDRSARPDFVLGRVVYAAGGGAQQYGSIVAKGPPADPDDTAALQVLRHLLGGLGSVIGNEVREEMGATYSVSTMVFHMRGVVWLVIGARYDRGKVVDALAAELETLARLRRGEVTEVNLRGARGAALGEWRGAMASVENMASTYANAIAVDERLTNLGELPLRLAKVGPADIQRVAQRYLDPERLHVVILGRAPAVLDPRLGSRGAPQEILLPK